MRRCITSCILPEVILLAKQRGCRVVKISSCAESSTWVDQDEGDCHQITQRQTRRHTHARMGGRYRHGRRSQCDQRRLPRFRSEFRRSPPGTAQPSQVSGRVMCGFREGKEGKGKPIGERDREDSASNERAFSPQVLSLSVVYNL